MDAASIVLLLAAVGVNLNGQPAGEAPKAAPTRHTTYFAGQAGWGPGNESPPPAAAPIYDRYQIPPAGSSSAVSPPPSAPDRARMAVTETGNALRDGVEAGIQEANNQLYRGGEQAIEATRNAGQEISQQFQSWLGTTGNSAQTTASSVPVTSPQPTRGRSQVSNPFAPANPTASAAPAANSRTSRGAAPPPWSGSAATATEPDWSSELTELAPMERTASVGTPATQTAGGGWTSLSSTLAPPPLMHSQLVNPLPSSAAQPLGAAPQLPISSNSGPGFPVTITAGQPSERSPAGATRQAPALRPGDENSGWALGWDGNSTAQPATIGRYGTDNTAARSDTAPARDLGAAQPAASGATMSSQPPAGRYDGWPDNDLFGVRQESSPSETVTQRDGATAPVSVVSNPATQPTAGSAAASAAPAEMTTNATPTPSAAPAAANALAQTPASDQPPWMPLLVVSLSLAGSLGANLFLGWSYVDARQKYRHLVQKTANKFRRATAA
ncbi:MAG: hypothetical protein L0228_13890 [Planctomycetes bacterium]|nr:hypothetical protein [Planctomycetota bacterium]